MRIAPLLIACAACTPAPLKPPANRPTGPTAAIGRVTAVPHYLDTFRGKAITIIETTIDGELVSPPRPSTDEIRAIVGHHLAELHGCYVVHLARVPGASGTAEVHLYLEPDGTASVPRVDGLPVLGACLADEVRRWSRLPIPRGDDGPRPRMYIVPIAFEPR